jgi:hypothetical protein
LLETYYRDGVVGDNEFPKEKKTIRVFYRNEYNMKPVDELHRFSSLRPALQASVAQVFFKTDAQVREQVINYILQRLPPNLTYAKENEKFITDISQVTGVKVVLIRSGDILVNRGQVVDTRAYYAIRASIAASNGTSRFSNTISRMSLFFGAHDSIYHRESRNLSWAFPYRPPLFPSLWGNHFASRIGRIYASLFPVKCCFNSPSCASAYHGHCFRARSWPFDECYCSQLLNLNARF